MNVSPTIIIFLLLQNYLNKEAFSWNFCRFVFVKISLMFRNCVRIKNKRLFTFSAVFFVMLIYLFQWKRKYIIIKSKNSHMQRQFLLFTLHYVILVKFIFSSTNPSKSISYTLGDNIVFNQNISIPNISPNSVQQFWRCQGGWCTKIWLVEYIQPFSLNFFGIPCSKFDGINQGEQCLDTDSINCNQIYYQQYNLTEGIEWQLTVDWIAERLNFPESTAMQILWNNQSIFSVYEDGDCSLKKSTFYVTSMNGINELAFQGLGIPDNWGILIRNIQLKPLTYAGQSPQPPSTNQYVNHNYTVSPQEQILLNNLLANVDSYIKSPAYSFYICNGANKALKFIFGYAIEMNRFILYNYHIRNFTAAISIILVSEMYLSLLNTQIIDKYIYPSIGTNYSLILTGFEKANNLDTSSKINYDLIKEYQNNRSDGFLLVITDFAVYSFPVAISLFIIGYILFKITFNYKISVIFRGFNFMGYIFCMVFEGKIQQFTFYYLSQLLLLVAESFSQKLKILVMVFYYFIVFFYAFGGIIYFRYLYRKKTVHLYQNCKSDAGSIVYMVAYIGFLNIFLGATHRLLIYYPSIQIGLIITIEIVFLAFQIYLLLKNYFKSRILGSILILIGICRILLEITFAIPMKFVDMFQIYIQYVQYYIYMTMNGCWMTSSIYNIVQKVYSLLKMVVLAIYTKCKDNTVAPVTTKKPKRNHTSKQDQNSQAKSKITFAQTVKQNDGSKLQQKSRNQKSKQMITIKKMYENNHFKCHFVKTEYKIN